MNIVLATVKHKAGTIDYDIKKTNNNLLYK
jgi:hypothetical protein